MFCSFFIPVIDFLNVVGHVYLLELGFLILENFWQFGVVYDGLFERDRIGGQHCRVDVGVFCERSVTGVLGFDQDDFEHAAESGGGADVMVHAVDGQLFPVVFDVDLVAKKRKTYNRLGLDTVFFIFDKYIVPIFDKKKIYDKNEIEKLRLDPRGDL